MQRNSLSLPRLALLHCGFLLVSIAAWSQSGSPQSRVVGTVDDAARVTLRGNTHPLAQPQFDRGAAPPDLPMARMLLVLKHSAEQEPALQKLLDDQQDQSSPSYHQWLTPDQFGQQFGPSDQDMQTVVAWLRSHGFQVATPSRGRTVIEFSGTAAQVQQAFQTEIHRFTVNGEDHWANASDPRIPAALAPVVEGIASLHNFPKRPQYRIAGKFSKERTTGRVQSLPSEFTPAPGSCPGGASNCYFVGPYDFAKVYNVLPLWNGTPAIDGTGQSIAIADVSNINVQDVRDFRNLFGLAPNDPQVFLDGPDPGLVPGAETEALLDVEWAGAVARGATIKLVVSAPTNSTEGADLAALYAIENNLAPIVSESFGDCELAIGTAGNAFENLIHEQAAAQGVTFLTSSGDQGSATCDGGGTPPAPATFGLAVSGLASSPYGVAVGGTEFLNFGSSYDFNTPSPYWNATNDSTQASAKGYIPETTWNDSCTNQVFVVFQWGSTPEASCNNPQLAQVAPAAISPIGGGGGKSNCTSSNGPNPANCTGHYAKPSWQSALTPADGARDLPDVSLFSSGGFMGSAYILCEADQFSPPQTCSLNSAFSTFLGIGGTSASAPAFAGMMALVNQFTGAAGEGNANYVLYKMAASSAQTSQHCDATSSPATGCVFYDVTSGTIAVPCARSSPDCTFSNASDTYGVLNGYNAGPGYDLATGLGSVNAYNLVHNWIGPANSSTTTLSLSLNGGGPISITHGQPVNFSIGVTPHAATGVVSLEGLPSGSGSVPMASFPLQNGAASGTTTALAGGNSYIVRAHYSGDGTYKPSDSSPVTVTVAKEPSTTLITIPTFDPKTGNETGNTPTSITYGTPVAVRVDVGNASAKTTFPEQLVCAPLTCPTGNVTLSQAFNAGSSTLLSPSAGFPLSSGGYALDYNIPLLLGGAYQFSASYPGDNSYRTSVGNYALTVAPAPMQMLTPPVVPSNPAIVGTPVTMSVGVNATSNFPGVAPTGTISFYDGATQLPGTVTYSAAPGNAGFSPPSLTGFLTATLTTNGTHQISAKYSGDANYGPSSTTATSVSAVFATSSAATANPTTINLGQNVSVTVTVPGASKTPPMTGTFQFQGLSTPVTGALGMDGSGNQTLTATASVTPQSSQAVFVSYSGDSNYESASASVFVTVNLPDFNMGTGAPSLTITAGQTGTTQVTLTPVNNIPDSVAVTCGSFQLANATCSFNPPSPLSLAGGTPASTTLSIATVPPSSNSTTTFVWNRHLPWNRSWPTGSGILALADGLAILYLSLSARWEKRRLAAALGMAGLLCLVLSCGSSNGGNGGGGGGGGGGPVPTSVTLTISSVKVQAGTPFTLTATVHSAEPVTGSVNFNDSVSGLPSAQVVNGVATAQATLFLVGTHTITAQYSGDLNNQPSQTTGSINQVITGTGQVSIFAAGKGFSHISTLNVTIQ
jgi:hypothetical protein